ncbi:MAG: DUF2852 domain-containing protein [Proteobacteria bacterium]|nr:DUF2852 domain-containing protein [Pseudomonadota bacterium]
MSSMVMRLDEMGKPAWIAAMVLGFVVFWPIGLAILAFLIASGRMGSCRRNWTDERRAGWENKMGMMHEKMSRWGCGRSERRFWGGSRDFTPSGNRAFDEYRAETIRRLEDEAGEFRDFLEQLRHAKDKAEFDQFMADRKNRPTSEPSRDQNKGSDETNRPYGA